MQELNAREQQFEARRLAEPPLTLEDLANEFGVVATSRQISTCFSKSYKAVRDKASTMQLCR